MKLEIRQFPGLPWTLWTGELPDTINIEHHETFVKCDDANPYTIELPPKEPTITVDGLLLCWDFRINGGESYREKRARSNCSAAQQKDRLTK